MSEFPVSLPLARQEQLIVKFLENELLVYDLARDKAHCLNQTAASVWKHCDGRTAPTEIAAKVSSQMGQTIKEDFVWLALDQLQKDHLLAGHLAGEARRISRREAVRRLGIGAAVALPIVASITAPTPAQAATCRASGQPCATSVQCCSGFCRSNGTCR